MSERKPSISGIGSRRPDFTVHQLTVFRTVAQHLSYTRASEVLYLSQPAVTQQIRTLEMMLGLRLFARKGRGIVLTPAGQELLRHVERLLALLTETAPVVHEIHALKRGSVVVGASTSAGTYIVPALLGAFHTHYPDVRITLSVATRSTIEERLLTRQVDLAVLSLVEQRDHFNVELLTPYELVVVAPPTHQLVGRTALTLHDLRAETFLLREQESGTRRDSEQRFVREGLPMWANLELGSIEAIKEGVAARLGIAVLSRESIALEVTHGDLAILDVAGFPLNREWHIVHLKNRRLSLAATALRQFLLQNK